MAGGSIATAPHRRSGIDVAHAILRITSLSRFAPRSCRNALVPSSRNHEPLVQERFHDFAKGEHLRTRFALGSLGVSRWSGSRLDQQPFRFGTASPFGAGFAPAANVARAFSTRPRMHASHMSRTTSTPVCDRHAVSHGLTLSL